MRKPLHAMMLKSASLAAALLAATGLASAATTVNLTAQRATAALPDGSSVPMWQYCGTAASGSTGTTVGGACPAIAPGTWAPGPTIVLPAGDALTVVLSNSLSVATSFTIVGQIGGTDTGAPDRAASPAHAPASLTTWPNNVAGSFTPPAQGSRARSFGPEALAGGTQTYTWAATTPANTLRPGTYLYETGTHPSLQAPMGLYGVLIVTAAPAATVTAAVPAVPATSTTPAVPGIPAITTITTAGQAYPNATTAPLPPGSNAYGVAYNGAPYDADATFLLSEIDAVQNAAVDAAALAGTSETLISTDKSCSAAQHGGTTACYPPAVNYRPTYFLVNGSPFNPANPAATTGVVADGALTGNVLVRFVNAGSRLHVPAISGLQMAVLSENGYLAPGLPKLQSEVNLPPGRVADVLVNPALATGTTIVAGVASSGAAFNDQAYAVFDRALSTAGANIANAGMHGYLAVAPAGTNASSSAINAFLGTASGGVGTIATSTAAASYTFTLAPNVLSKFTASVATNNVGLTGYATGSGPSNGTLAWSAGGTFTYTPATPTIGQADSFTYCTATAGCGTVQLNLSTETAAIVAPATGPTFTSTVSTLYRAITRSTGVLGGYSTSDGYPLVAALSGTPSGCKVVLNADGSFSAAATARTGSMCTFGFTATDPRNPTTAVTGSATVTFPAPTNLAVTVQDALNGSAVTVGDYMWIIQEDRSFRNATPGVTPPMVNGQPTPVLTTSFHNSHYPVVAVGCTGPVSCGDGSGGQKIQGVAAPTAIYTSPADAVLDPTKNYYISVLPGDAANPFTNGFAGDPTQNSACLFKSGKTTSGPMATDCGHSMGGANILKGQASATVLVEPNPLKPAALSIYIFEDNSPTNNDYDANEIGLGGFEVIVNDVGGRSGDPVGQVTYDAFNMPLTNALLGVAGCPNETPAGTAALQQTNLVGVVYTCPDGDRQISSIVATASTITVTTAVPHQFGASVQGPGPTIDISGVAAVPLNGSFTINVTGANTFTFANPGGVAAGNVQVWKSSIARDSTTYQLAGQALINNIMPGRYDVLAHPGAYREGSGETWYQVSTLEGTPGQDAFTKANEPNYFQEFGPPGFHTFIGWLNPAHIADQNAMALAQATAAGATATTTISGRVTSLHMSRTIMETLWDSASNAAIQQSTCFVAVNQTGETGNDVAFTACKPDGTFTLPPIPSNQQYELVIWDQWLDQIIAFQNLPANQVSTPTLVLGDIPVFSWFTRLESSVYMDLNNNGVRDPGEPGIPLVPVKIHFRDGSISNTLITDGNGNAVFNELFPLFNWYVVESDRVRYASTGVNVTVDAGGQPDCVTTNTSTGQGTLATTATCASTTSRTAGVANTQYVWTDPTTGLSYGAVPPKASTSTNRIDAGTTPYNGMFEGMQTFINQTQFLDFGRRNFAVGENGGIQGTVVYSSTRGFDDPTLQVQNLWEPGIPRVTLNLYKEQVNADGTTGLVYVNTTTSTSWDDWANGVLGSDGNQYVLFPDNTLHSPVTGAPAPAGVTSTNVQTNITCPGQDAKDPYLAYSLGTANQFKCYDGFHMWNQVQPAVFDGAYMFPGAWKTSVTTTVAGVTTTVYTPHVLTPGTYVVEVVPPPGYEVVKEEDKNILIGDQWVAPAAQQFGALTNIFVTPDQASLASAYNPNNPGNNNTTLGLDFTEANYSYPKCVGTPHQVPDFMSLFPSSGQVAPFAGAMKNLCDRKEVVLNDQSTGEANFFLFTNTPRASHFTGLMLDDAAAEINAAAPDFGEKFAASYAPIAIRDFNGVEVSRIYTDAWGGYNGIIYSTWQVNVPNPAGYSPNMMVNCMNDPGPIPDPTGTTDPVTGKVRLITDPQYNPQYSNFCYTNPFMPGMTVYLDTPILPVAAFAAGYNPPDCALPASTPAILRVDGDGVGPWVLTGTSAVASLTVTNSGSGYNSLPTVTIGGGGNGATAVVTDLKVVGAGALTNPQGNRINGGYTTAPAVTFGSFFGNNPGSGAAATATINAAGAVTGISITAAGSGYTAAPTITIAAPPTAQAVATVTAAGLVTITNAGAGYCSVPQVTVNGGTRTGGARWTAAATVSGFQVTGITINQGTAKYSVAPTLNIAAPNCGAPRTTALMGVDTLTLTANGSGYTAPTVSFRGGNPTTVAAATAALGTGKGAITITALGDVTIPNPNYQGPTATTAPWNQKNLTRHYGFGASQGSGSVNLNGTNLHVNSWSDTKIVALVGGATTGELSITSGNGLKSVDAVTVTTDVAAAPVVVEPALNVAAATGNAHPIQDAIDAAKPGDLIIVDAGQYPELVVMWKPVRLQGVGAASVVINAAKYPTQKLLNWRPIVNKYFGVDTVLGNQVPNSQVDPLPNQEITGGIVLLEPSVLATEEGAGITVLGKNPASAPCGSTATSSYPDQVLFPPTSNTVNIISSTTKMSDSNFTCAPSRIDGISVTGGDSGGGIYVNGWANGLEVANNRVYGNAGSFNGGVRVGVPYLEALTSTPTNGDGTVFGYDVGVHIHHNVITNNGTVEANPGAVNSSNSTGVGGGLSICTGTDNYVVNYNFICGNYSAGDGGGIGQTGVSNNGLISQNTIIFNQSYQQTAQVNGGGIVIEGELGTIGGTSLGTGSVTIDKNEIRGNFSQGGHGGGIRLQQVNGSDVANSPKNPANWYTVTITNNMITNNVSGWAGAGISAVDALKVNVANNTVANNDSMGIVGEMIGTDPLNHGAGKGLGKTTGYPSPAGVSVDRTTPTLLTGMSAANQATYQYAGVTLYNDIIWHNRSFYFAITQQAGVATPTNTLCPSNNVGDAYNLACSPLPAQTAIGQCVTGAAYWDIGTTDDASVTPGSEVGTAPKFVLSPTYSILSSTTGYPGASAHNSTTNPGFALAYCNGARANPAFIFEPGQPFLSPATQNLTAGATLDEAGNFVDVRFGPLYLFNPLNASTTSPGTVIGDYHLAAALGLGGSIAGQPLLSSDYDGDARPQNGRVDVGADEFVPSEAGSTPAAALTLGNAAVGFSGGASSNLVIASNVTSASQTLTLTNTGAAAFRVTGVSALTTTSGNAYAVTNTTCTAGTTLAPGTGTCTVTVSFTSTSTTTTIPGTVTVTGTVGGTATPVTFALTGS